MADETIAKPDLSDLRAADINYNLRTLVRFEEIIGADKFREVLRLLASEEHAAIDVSMKERMLLMTDIFGYVKEDALELPFEIMEAELSCFFQMLLERSLTGRLSFIGGRAGSTKKHPTQTVSQPAIPRARKPKRKTKKRLRRSSPTQGG